MKLAIVESPAKAETIEKYLGEDFEVEASLGHVRDLPKSDKDALDIEAGFVPNYEVSEDKHEVVEELENQAHDADEIILATDPDREGEAIAWHVGEVLGLDYDADSTKRITFHEITEDAVQDALANPRKIDTNLRRAQEARRVLDRIFGYRLSELIWKKVRYGLSAGRVQSPALRIIMEREREIRAFDPEDYWVITANVSADDMEFTVECEDEPRDEDVVEEITTAGKNNSWEVADIKEKNRTRNPYPPFKTSTLQRAGSTRLNFSPSRTMRAAQKLYEAGDITYMRTDSTTLSSSAQKQIIAYITDEYDKDKYLQPRQYQTDDESAQEAHEAIRPTTIAKHKADTDKDAKKLYELIWRRAVASQMSAAKLKRTKIVTNILDDGQDSTQPAFSVSGTRTVFPGWLDVHPAARGKDVELPDVDTGQKLDLEDIGSEKKQTQPPNRYTEAGIVKELEDRGIGRPSTYDTIINTLQERDYVYKDGRTLHPTDTGDVVSSFLEEHFADYISDDFTARMETELDEIADGERKYEPTLQDFYDSFIDKLKDKEDIEKQTTLGPAPNDEECPECGDDMVVKLGKAGKLLSCANCPDCDGARTMDGESMADVPLGTHPDEDEPIYVKDGPYGPYLQLGEDDEDPKRVSIQEDQDPDEIDMEQAVKLLSIPRELGEHPETGKDITASIGPYGPYVQYGDEYQSLGEYEDLDVYTITREEALELVEENFD
jgi:DNA topoisomerase-1